MSGYDNLSLTQAISTLMGSINTATAAVSGSLKQRVKYSTATCLDPQCGTVLYFPSHEASVECTGCGQRHTTSLLKDVHELTEKEEKSERFARSFTEMKSLFGGKKTAELVKVNGISNYQCKLLSHLLTTHGKDRNDRPCLLKDLGLGEVFDCSKLGSRAFAIEESMLDIKGYGEDKSGSLRYLKKTLDELSTFNGGRKCLVPIHADGDGHCLVHAISRCLVGRELFWHALRTNMQSHLKSHHDWYVSKLKGFSYDEDWAEIISEADPDYEPPPGVSIGLRNVHIFALANVLRRPIIVLDGNTGIASDSEYSCIFLPSFYKREECLSPGSTLLNSPITIAWSNSGYNHFVPLVPIKDKPLPRLPSHFRPNVWCEPEETLLQYVSLEDDGSIVLARGKPLQEAYIQKLVSCMDQLFLERYSVSPSLVADFNEHVYRKAGYVGVSLKTVTMETKLSSEEKRLFRCLMCSAIANIPRELLRPDGALYETTCSEFSLEDGEKYSFPIYRITAEYSAAINALIPIDVDCFQCGQTARRLLGDGTILFENGDRTGNRADPLYSRCCGFKHYWNGKEYDNMPQPIKISLTWKGVTKTVIVYWFQYEKDPSLNSNIYEVAYQTVAEHFPGEFGSEQLVQQVVDMIVFATEKKEKEGGASSTDAMETEHEYNDLSIEDESPKITKTIVTGMMNRHTKVLHKEELGVSETERKMKRKVDAKLQQLMTTTAAAAAAGNNPDSAKQGGRKTNPSPSANELSSITPPQKISPTSKPPTQLIKDKRIRVTSSEGKNSNITLKMEDTFHDFQIMIEKELGIPLSQQKLRWGFPPKELLAPEDPRAPLPLSHGERVSVERVGGAKGGASDIPQYPSIQPPEREKKGDIKHESSSALVKDIDSFGLIECYPYLFRKGGHCYEELMRANGGNIKDHSHAQFAEIPSVTFRYNASSESLEVCLGDDHVPAGPLSMKQKRLALLASAKEAEQTQEHVGGVTDPKWLVNRSSSSGVKAFTGTGRTLGGERELRRKEDTPTAKQQEEQQEGTQSYVQTLLQAAKLIADTRINELKIREKQLLLEMQLLNQQLQLKSMENKTNAKDEGTLSLETRVLEMSSEIKELRDEIRDLSSI
ncbi:PREDICTED: deubiquitinating protein VCIP135-like isoform X2 [Amphimedon queenslandica]|uniref:ubiquitinyl hydrolase 1 n=1 Tax=Amphimedon queenslandica TaxID=400682 RepID=A0A1X7V0H2_AMPQE|nr:PREDICTED: deubiquitinating protein VCIP135-like isoform X2 [Amphimedon queenslandica]|eukprot:XP_019851334.1 PREDICTED: deubiquitinating protein VCIP135-like isoform X2 [Amphimedon queenslandica]